MKGVQFGLLRIALRAALILLIGLVGGGCVHTDASLTISGDDRVSGKALVTTQTADGKVPFRLAPPRQMADRVRITPYTGEGRVGAKVSFRDLTFHEVEQLSAALNPSGSRYQLHLSRSGSLVVFESDLDLTPLTGTDSSIEIAISAPGEITNTNGEQAAGTVVWRPEPGELSNLSAIYQFAGVRSQGWVGWALLLAAGGLASSALIGVLALSAHQRARREAGDRGY